MEMENKVCSVCHVEKPVSEFYKMNEQKLHARCKDCYKQMRKEFYEKNKHIISMKYSVEYYKKKPKNLKQNEN
jgi:NAD-dependent SIR2 family protein deacetylase